MPLPLVRLAGTPYEQGVQHGSALREQIAQNQTIYFARFERELKLSRAEVLRRADLYAQAIAGQNADYHAGMRGIAAGSGFDFAAIAALNVRYELFYDEFPERSCADGCTAFALTPGVTVDAHLLIGENWDWIPDVRGAVLQTTELDGLQTLSFSEAGIFGGKIGLNSAGLGLAINGLVSNHDDWSRLHKPFHVRCYEVLRSLDIAGAARVISASDRSCSANFLLAQAPDQVLNIETAPLTSAFSSCVGGCLVHSNHFVDPSALAVAERSVEKNPHSYWRYKRLDSLLRKGCPLHIEDVQAALRDHDRHPYSVCFHIDPSEPPEEHYASVVSTIIDLHARTMLISDGPPCNSPYECYNLPRYESHP